MKEMGTCCSRKAVQVPDIDLTTLKYGSLFLIQLSSIPHEIKDNQVIYTVTPKDCRTNILAIFYTLMDAKKYIYFSAISSAAKSMSGGVRNLEDALLFNSYVMCEVVKHTISKVYLDDLILKNFATSEEIALLINNLT